VSDDDGAGSFELTIEPTNASFHEEDERWRDQVAAFYADLQGEADLLRRSTTVAGTKGAVEEVIVALGSAGAFTAAVEFFRAWLARDRSRHIDVRWNEDGVERYVTLVGDAVDVESVREIARAAARRVGGQAWPESTERS
jgi:hypothetical protein